MSIPCMYTTRKTQKNKKWKDGTFIPGCSDTLFCLCDEDNTELLSGQLKESPWKLLESTQDDVTVEFKEYLILLEKNVLQGKNSGNSTWNPSRSMQMPSKRIRIDLKDEIIQPLIDPERHKRMLFDSASIGVLLSQLDDPKCKECHKPKDTLHSPPSLLPRKEEISQKQIDYYVMEANPSFYPSYISSLLLSSIRYMVYVTSSKLCEAFPSMPSTDCLPSLEALRQGLGVIQQKGIHIWMDVTLTRKKEDDSCRFYLSAPSFELKESLFNHLLLLSPCAKKQPFFCRSLWHGFSSNHLLEVGPVEMILTPLETTGRQEKDCIVVDYGSMDVEYRVFSHLSSLPSLTLYNFLSSTNAGPAKPLFGLPDSFLQAAKSALLEHYSLNTSQMEVVEAVLTCLSSQPAAPLQLIQGVFGSGKSLLLSSLLVLLQSIQQSIAYMNRKIDEADFLGIANKVEPFQWKKTCNVLFCSHTNVAVDRVCLLLKEKGFVAFSRGGNAKRINKEVKEHYKKEGAYLVHCNTICGLSEGATYDIVIIDEATQITEYHSLLPILLNNPKLVLLVGDPKQLPPIPIPGMPALSLSMFERLLPTAPLHFLKEQYRCHPDIAGLSSHLFYQDQILSSPTTFSNPLPLSSLPRLLFLHNPSPESPVHDSFVNEGELMFLRHILQKAFFMSNSATIGVISLYAAQCSLLERKLDMRYPVSTVDAFQGSEKDVIVLSTVRSKSIGFAGDERRLNVAITRAKCQLIIIGNEQLLSTNTIWKSILDYIRLKGKVLQDPSSL